MLTILRFEILESGGRKHARATATLKRDLPFAPCPGMSFGSAAWKAAREITHVIIDLDDSSPPVIRLGPVTAHSDDEYAALVEGYRSQGWDVSGDWVVRRPHKHGKA
ncbi:hypothetical protein PHYC_00986 [Phycisphaerales bacterium]|nr:hypothetical protein PHYC_00986 [Phycisphaerales bacterium]